MADNPLVSVITPVLNGIRYLEECIQSVLNQRYPYTEHIFVDGGSTDGTLDMLTSYNVRYPDRIRFISEPDKNAREAWNKGWEIARGDIFGWLGSDDLYEPDAILLVVDFFRANLDAYFVFGACNFFMDGTNKIFRQIGNRDYKLDELINDDCYVAAQSAFYKREVIDKIGYMDTSLYGCDLDFWIRAGKVFRIYRIEKVLSRQRFHPGSITVYKGAEIYPREGFIISRRHGGRLLSNYAKRYYRYLIMKFLRLGPTRRFLGKVLRKYHLIADRD